MLLSVKYNFLFVHIARTGGTSVREALQPLRWRDPWYYAQGVCHRLSKASGDRIGMKFPRHADAILAKEALPGAFFEVVCRPIGIPAPALLHKRKSSSRSRDYRTYYDDEAAELVGTHFARDVDMLGYRFDTPEARGTGTDRSAA